MCLSIRRTKRIVLITEIAVYFDNRMKHVIQCVYEKYEDFLFLKQIMTFLGALAKFRKGTISFPMSVRPPALVHARNNSAPTGRIFMKFDI
jgi:hypothetical protein